MFIFSKWDKVCKELSGGFNCIRADKILEQPLKAKWIVIKHDVEINVSKALKMAQIEAKYGIPASYYVQANLLEENLSELKEIQSLGHEVTYHFDVLDANDGDFKAAQDSFLKIVNAFNHYDFQIKTVCPHGNPIKIRKGWSSNKDFFKSRAVSQAFPDILDIIVHLPKKVIGGYAYVSDAGYGWKKIMNIDTNDKNPGIDIVLEKFSDMLNIVHKEERLILSTHPHRWEKNQLFFLSKLLIFKSIRFIAKKLSSISFVKRIMSKYYYLAKRI